MTIEEAEKVREITARFLSSTAAQDGQFTVTDAIMQAMEFGRRQALKNTGMLRQWINEDVVTDVRKMVTNGDILHWLEWSGTVRHDVSKMSTIAEPKCHRCGVTINEINEKALFHCHNGSFHQWT